MWFDPLLRTNKINDLQKSGFMKNMKAAFVLCNSCVIVSEKISLRSLSEPVPFFQFIHCALNMLTVLMRIPRNHNQCFAPADSLHCRQIDAGLNKVSNCRVAQGVFYNLFWVKPGGFHNTVIRRFYITHMSGFGGD